MNAAKKHRRTQIKARKPGRVQGPSRWQRVKTIFIGFEHVVLVATFISVIIGVIAFVIDYEDRKMAREDMRNNAITRAWTLITTPAVGNSGKGPALEYLYAQGVPLKGIDLSCETMGGTKNWDAESGRCTSPTYLRFMDLSNDEGRGVDLSRANLQGTDLLDAKLRGAHLLGTNLQGAHLLSANLQGAGLSGANLQGAHLSGANLQGADLSGADLQGARLWDADLQGANLRFAIMHGANLSNANFTDVKRIDAVDFTESWAWADWPPTGIDAARYGIALCVYDDTQHKRWEKPTPCIPPNP